MSIRGLNHITLATADLDRSVAFYRDVLGLRLDRHWEGGAYFSAGALWLCLSHDPEAAPSTDYTHLALDIADADFAPMAARISQAGARVWNENRSEGASLYFCDPDGHKLELHVGTLASRLAAYASQETACCT